jgi:hypothetical protein
LDNDLCKDYIGDTEVVNHDGEEAEMIELCAGDIEATNLNEEETAMSDLLAPSTRESSAQNILDNPTTKDRGDHFQFGSVFIKKKITKLNLKKKKRNRVKPTGFGSVRFSFLGKKPVQNGLAQFFRFCLDFFRFGSVFPALLGFSGLARFFFLVFSVSVRFGFFSFLLIKSNPNRTGWFFQNFNRFLFGSVFLVIFFWFSWFN